ncbi:MAG: sodium:alanine symporter family protein [Candidatus Cloacimonetes bacterium 4572_55]|nr:MAG: sodium:alanine symporter family protein [Candidatus Cloacimonetes bacterium 4572_55]
MQFIQEIVSMIGGFVWGPVMILFLVGTGLFLTIRFKFIQFTGFGHALGLLTGKYDDPEDTGDITHFQALSAALSATIGTGNIAGVATAIASGGPGAVFWMWITALVGMATKFTSCLLSQKYRKVNEQGIVSGGPMYYLEHGLGQKWLGVLFALFTVIASFGIGNMVQANSVAEPLYDILNVPKWITGTVLALLVAMVILGGIRRIAVVAGKIVPLMVILYVGGALIILFHHIDQILPTLKLIVEKAFTPTAAIGGFTGATVMQTVRFGVARGIFSNESGLGSAPIAHAAAKTKEPVREGLVASVGPFIDTIVVCTMTALIIVLSGLWHNVDGTGAQLTGATLSARAFESGIPFGQYIISFGLVFFAFSTILAWSYYGDRSAEYLFGSKAVKPYRWLWVIIVPIGATSQLDVVWNLSDAANGLMAIPNLIGLIGLSGVVAAELKDYLSREHKPYGQ